MSWISVNSFRKMRSLKGLERARRTGHSVTTIVPIMQQLRTIYPKAGAREIKSLAFHEQGESIPRQASIFLSRNLILSVDSRSVIQEYFRVYESQLLRERIRNRLRRKRFWAAGIFDVVAVDQHDKWLKKFGLGLHTGLDPFAGKGHWMKIWWTNRNPRLILSYYLEMVERHKGKQLELS